MSLTFPFGLFKFDLGFLLNIRVELLRVHSWEELISIIVEVTSADQKRGNVTV